MIVRGGHPRVCHVLGVCPWLVGWSCAGVCLRVCSGVFVCALVSAFVCSFRGLFAYVLSWVHRVGFGGTRLEIVREMIVRFLSTATPCSKIEIRNRNSFFGSFGVSVL